MWQMRGVSVTDGKVKMMIHKSLHLTFKSLPYFFFQAFGKVFLAFKISLWGKTISILFNLICERMGTIWSYISPTFMQYLSAWRQSVAFCLFLNIFKIALVDKYNPSLSTNQLQHSPGCPPNNLICHNSGPYIAPTSFRPPHHEGEILTCASVSKLKVKIGMIFWL